MSFDPRQQIWPIFVEETREHLQLAGEYLLALEQPPGSRPEGRMVLLLRALHSMKGGAGSLGFSNIERLAHALESSLARQPPEPLLTRTTVNSVLDGMRLLEAMVRRIEAGVGDEAPAELRALLARLGGASAPAVTATTTAREAERQASPSPEREGHYELWPVFRADVFEGLSLLSEGLRNRRSRPEPAELERLRELTQSLRRLGATLGLELVEERASSLSGLLEAPWSTEALAAAGSLLGDLERFCAETDERLDQLPESPATPPPPLPPLARASPEQLLPFYAECVTYLTGIEATMALLLTPDPQRRANAVLEVQQLATRLETTTAAVLQGRAAALSAELVVSCRALGAGGVEGAMASSRVARLLVEYRAALDQTQEQPEAPPPAVVVPPVSARPAGPADSVIRVSRNAVEALTDVLDRTAMARARREGQLRTLAELRALTQEALLSAERAASELRVQEVQSPHLSDARERLRTLSSGMKEVSAALWRDLESERIQGAQLKDTLRELRTVPAHTLGELLRRTARETAGRVGKNARVELVGGDVRLDRRIVDAVRDPLLHLLRNAIDHGLEAPQTRLARGKDAEGCITVKVEQRGGRVVFFLSDDGAGLDLARIRERALSRGLYDARALEAMSDAQVMQLIFLPGFSTAQSITEISGRGVGLDVVESVAKSLGGSVSVEHTPGRGTSFQLELPRALGALLGVVARVGQQLWVLPNDSVMRLLRLTHRDLSAVGGRPMAKVGGELLPFVPLARLLGVPGSRLPLEGGEPVVAVVLASGQEQIALAVDELVSHQELVVHSLGKHLKDTRHFVGAAQLNDGTVVPVLQGSELIAMASRPSPGLGAGVSGAPILVADDALSTRMVIRSLLEIAGFEVLVAGDGEEAWQLLQTRPVSLLITDLQMPRLDGLALTRRVRADARWKDLPVVVVTAQNSASDLAVGLEAGADAYLIKQDIERGALLERVRQLLVVDP